MEPVLFRPHRLLLEESMAEVTQVSSMEDLRAALARCGVPAGEITVEPYGGWDERIGWDTHIVCVDGEGQGFTSGPLEELKHSREARGVEGTHEA